MNKAPKHKNISIFNILPKCSGVYLQVVFINARITELFNLNFITCSKACYELESFSKQLSFTYISQNHSNNI